METAMETATATAAATRMTPGPVSCPKRPAPTAETMARFQ